MAVTTIREIRNNTRLSITLQNLEDPADTGGGRITLGPNEVRIFPPAIELNVPWCGDLEQNDFARRHIRVDVQGRGSFFIWQASHDGLDRVRVSMDGKWHKPGEVVGAFAAVGVLEELLGTKERTLVINDFTVWLLPFSLSQTLRDQTSNEPRTVLCGAPLDRPVSSVPKKSAIAFSLAGPASDAFDAHRPGARYLYRDSGKRYELQLSNGVLQFTPAARGATSIDTSLSFRTTRAGQSSAAPRLDLIAASGGRVFAKEEGVDRFYFALLDEGYVHAAAAGVEFAPPSSALVLDPEFNRDGASFDALTQPLSMEFHDFEGHPANERWPVYRLVLSYGLADFMLVRVPRLTWMQMETRPPRGGQSDKLFAQLKTMAQDNGLLLMCLAGLTGLASTPLPDAPGPEPAGSPLPLWVPTYKHVSYCVGSAVQFSRESADYKRVLDVGVGHVHHHQQYEGITGGEIQPFFIDWSNPNWLFNAAAQYRFMFGPVRDGDGHIDGTCNFYLLVQLKDDAQIRAAETDIVARRSAYAALWIDEQSYFTQRWHVVHPDDHYGALISMVERVHTNPGRYGWDGTLFWCPFRTGHIGPRSRMAVAAQVIVVTGEHPDTRQAELYSINFSFGTMDRSWHWRGLPAPARYFDGASLWTPPASTVAGDEQVPAGTDACVYPQTVRLREDMTLCVKGRGPGRDGRMEVGYWYQSYLPSTNTTLPAGAQLAHGPEPSVCGTLTAQLGSLSDERQALLDSLTGLDPRSPIDRVEIRRINSAVVAIDAQVASVERQRAVAGCAPNASGARPSRGYEHGWRFMPEPLFALADRFSHFGIYDIVDSRSQYYLVTEADAALLEAGHSGGWIDEAGQLAVDAYSFRFDWMRLPWPPHVPPPLAPKPRPSLFNADVRLRILRRGSRWIAVHWDKRDDDLMPFVGLPKRVTLKFRSGPELKDGAGTLHDASVTLSAGNDWVRQPPGVRLAYLKWDVAPPSTPRAVLGFLPSRLQSPVDNVWRVRVAAMGPTPGDVVQLLDVITEGAFKATVGGSHEYRWSVTAETQAKLQLYCSPEGAVKYGTSVWFEDIVGHVSRPESIEWLRAPTIAEMRDAVKMAAYFNWKSRLSSGTPGDARGDWFAARAQLGIPPDAYL